jgi:FK506-binding protein 1
MAGAFLSTPLASSAEGRHLDLGHNFGLYVCQDGDGQHFPKAGDTLTMHYIGRLTKDDSQFDSSRDRGKPFTFKVGVGKVIAGWDEGVPKMSLGSRAILQVPAEKGYGARGFGGVIPPNADLYFDVELLAINGKEKPEKLPEQGYSGDKVAHEDMKTCVGDWRREYGPKMGEEGPCTGKNKKEPKAEPAPKKSGSPRQFGISWSAMWKATF